MPRIGVVGPGPSVERIFSVASKLNLKLELIPFCYKELPETAHIVTTHGPGIDGWLFSGPAPYMIARNVLGPETIAVSCLHVGAGLYRSILQMSQQVNRFAGGVTIDLPQDEGIDDNLEEALEELQLSTEKMHIKYYTRDFHGEELVRFHKELFDKGLSDGAITSLHSIYQELKQRQVPVVHNTSTKMEMKLAINTLAEMVNAAYFKNTQVGVEIIDVGIFSEGEKLLITPYQLQNLELDIKRVLIQLSQKVEGCLMEKGGGRYEIFSSRGAVERELQSLEQAVAQIGLLVDAPISVGIGFGATVYAAETHAFGAINHAKGRKGGVVLIRDDGVLVEAPGNTEELQYEYCSQDDVLLAKLKSAGVSVKIYQKIVALSRRMGWHTFTVSQMAERLSVTPRNVSRVMTGLVGAGLAEYAGQEAVAERGRPSKVFRITI